MRERETEIMLISHMLLPIPQNQNLVPTDLTAKHTGVTSTGHQKCHNPHGFDALQHNLIVAVACMSESYCIVTEFVPSMTYNVLTYNVFRGMLNPTLLH